MTREATLRIYHCRHLERLAEDCRALLAGVKAKRLPAPLSLALTVALAEARAQIIEAEIAVRQDHNASRLLLKALQRIRRAYRKLQRAYHQHEVPGPCFKSLADELLRLQRTLRALRDGLLLAPGEPL